jgi:hypoxanthine-DNA glycosylase
VLVLGTLPGEESLRRREYYAHPRNLLWPILAALVGAQLPANYAEKVALVIAHRVALWDVVAAGQRLASADSTIRSEEPNRIDLLLDSHPAIQAVVFNGSTARRLYDRHFSRRPHLVYLPMPSTSPAHARLGFAEKLGEWQALLDILNRP